MVKILSWLFLLTSLLGISNVQANCYAGQWSSTGPVYSSLFVTGSTTLQQCQALACSIYPNTPGCPSTCQAQTETQTLSCPVNQNGQVTQSRTYSCQAQSWGSWTTTQNTCTPKPATCQTPTETQTLSCPTGYTGSIIQTRTSSCPDPYGSPVFAPWAITTNSCVKSVSNPTNPTSPISPINPLSNPMGVSPLQSQGTDQTQGQSPLQSSTTTSTSNTSAQTTPSGNATAGTSAQTTTSNQPTTPKGKVLVPGLGLALSLELLKVPTLVQPNPFPEDQITQSMKMFDGEKLIMEFLAQPTPTQKPLKQWNFYE